MTDIIFYVFIFLLGLTVGSFLNCVIYRMEKGESALKGRSYCPKCKHQLAWYDLVPVLSFFILKGKCRYCKKTISWQYPIIEISTALLFLLILNSQFSIFNEFSIFNFQTFVGFCFVLCVSCFMIVIFVYDLRHYIIPDKVIFPAISITFIYQLFENWGLGFHWSLGFGIWDFVLMAFIAAGFFLAIVLITKGKGMGFGDVKLAFLMGLLLGLPNIFVALFFAFLIGAIIGIGLILAKKKTLKSEIPFGPFLVTGTFIALFLGQQLVDFYLNLFI